MLRDLQDLSEQVNGLTLATATSLPSSAEAGQSTTDNEQARAAQQPVDAPSSGNDDITMHEEGGEKSKKEPSPTPVIRTRPRRLFPGVNWRARQGRFPKVNWRERQARFVASIDEEAKKAKQTLPPVQDAVREVRSLASESSEGAARQNKLRQRGQARQSSHARRQSQREKRRRERSTSDWKARNGECSEGSAPVEPEYTELVSDTELLEAERLAYKVNK